MTPRQQAEQVASSLWADVDWLDEQEQAASTAPGAIGFPAWLIGAATERMAAKIEAAILAARRDALLEAAEAWPFPAQALSDNFVSVQTWLRERAAEET